MPIMHDFLAGRSPPDLYHLYLMPAFEPWARTLTAALPPKGHALDLACGTGLVSRILAGNEAVEQVRAIDVAPPMIDKAKALSQDHAAKIDYQVASALELPFADAQFDCCYCQQGLQFFPNKPAALREVKRVLKPSARAAFSTWCSAANGNPVFAAFEQIVAERLGDDLIPFGPFSFGERSEVERVANEAELEVIPLEPVSIPSILPDPRNFVLFDLAFLGRPAPDGTLMPILDFDDPASDAVIEGLIERMQRATADYVQADGTLLAPMQAHILVVEA